MTEEQLNRTVARRRLLRRAGTVVAGVAGAGVVSSIVAAPAEADDGDPVIIGQANTGQSQTSLSTTSASSPTLLLQNGNSAGPALALSPVDTTAVNPTTNGPVGSLIADVWGDFYGIGDPDGGGKFLTPLYSSTWASMVIPVDPFRWLDTRPGQTIFGGLDGRTFASGATYDTSGRVNPKNTTSADLILNVSQLIDPPGGSIGAVQLNLVAVLGSVAGYAGVWGGGSYPGTSSINFPAGTAIANFVQVPVDPATSLIRFKVSTKVALIVDISGFVVSDPFAQLGFGPTLTNLGAAQNSSAIERFNKRRPKR